jgi:hypothetical protein
MSYALNLDQHRRATHNAGSASPEAGSFDRLNVKADKPLSSGFFTSVNTTVAPSRVGRSGDTFGYAGFLNAGRSTLLRACHPHLTVWSGLLNPVKEAIIMPKLARVLLSHFSFAAVLLAAYNHAPLIVVLLSVFTLVLVHVIGGKDHA